MYHTLYTLGYAGWSIDQLATEVVDRLDGLLVDIRMQPWSKRPEWQKASLAAHFGPSRYTHLPALGNRNYQGGPIELAAPERAVQPLTKHLMQYPIVLLCGCRDWRTCHRAGAAAYLSQQLGGLEIVHLEPPSAPVADGAIPALTVKQPWAWAIFHLGKDIENREHAQFRAFRGLLAIHTSKSVPKWEYAEACDWIERVAGKRPPAYGDLDHGAAIGTVEVDDFVEAHPSRWWMGPYGLVLRDPRLLATPIPARGTLGIWQWTPPEGWDTSSYR